MPSSNIVKTYASDSFYHVYNRGVEKRVVYLAEADYIMFYTYMLAAATKSGVLVVDYVLVKNHYHMLVYQNHSRSIERFMRSLCTRYSLYFNFKYLRVGSLFQGNYKARLIKSAAELITIKSYLEKNREEDQGWTFVEKRKNAPRQAT